MAVAGASRPQLAVGLRQGHGCAVYVGTASGDTPYRRYLLPQSRGPCSSLSWDGAGNLWAVAGWHIWILRPAPAIAGLTVPMAVATPGDLRVIALRIAPDGVRAGLLASTMHGNKLLLATAMYGPKSVSFGPLLPVDTDLADPIALSWYSAADLAVISKNTIYRVPLTGVRAESAGPAPAQATSLTCDGTTVTVGTRLGDIFTSRGSGGFWTRIASGFVPAYPS